MSLQAGFGLVYCRDVKSLKLADRDRDKKYEYFLLTRDAESPEKESDGRLPEHRGCWRDGNVHFYFKPEGGRLFREFTGKNIGHLMAVDLDGQIQSIATIKSAIGEQGQITGHFTPDQLNRYVTVLRAGALPGPSNPIPSARTPLPPRWVRTPSGRARSPLPLLLL